MTTPTHEWMLPPAVVLAAVDFEPASIRAATLAGAIATASRAELRVVHAERIDAPPYFTPQQIAALEDERRKSTRELTTELQRLVAGATTRLALDRCDADALTQATLVVVAGPRERAHWGLSDVVTDALGHCARPVLFLPAR